MSTFEEAEHPRAAAGKFTEKSNSAPDVGLTADVELNPKIVTIFDEITVEAAHVEARLWNGFSVPYFTRENTDKIAEWCETLNEGSARLRWDGDDLYEVSYEGTEEEWRTPVPTMAGVDGETLYGVGADGWTWQEPAPKPIEDRLTVDERAEPVAAFDEAWTERNRAIEKVEKAAALRLKQLAADSGATAVRLRDRYTEQFERKVEVTSIVFADGSEFPAEGTAYVVGGLQRSAALADRELDGGAYEIDAAQTGMTEADFEVVFDTREAAERGISKAASSHLRKLLPEGSVVEAKRDELGSLAISDDSLDALAISDGDAMTVRAKVTYIKAAHAGRNGFKHDPVTGTYTMRL